MGGREGADPHTTGEIQTQTKNLGGTGGKRIKRWVKKSKGKEVHNTKGG